MKIDCHVEYFVYEAKRFEEFQKMFYKGYVVTPVDVMAIETESYTVYLIHKSMFEWILFQAGGEDRLKMEEWLKTEEANVSRCSVDGGMLDFLMKCCRWRAACECLERVARYVDCGKLGFKETVEEMFKSF